MKSLNEKITAAFGVALAISYVSLVFIFPIAVWSWQIYQWLRTSEWQALSMLSLLHNLDMDTYSIYGYLIEKDWKGVAKIFSWLTEQPASLVVPFSSFLILISLMGLVKEQKKVSNKS